MRLGIGLNITRQNEVFRLSNLFSRSEPGITFEPWDMTTLYQDRAGTTPVTAVGQSVGLRLSKDKGLALGAELATNGGFSSDTGWSKETGWSISGGLAIKTSGSAGSLYQSAAGMTQGRTYLITFTVSGYSAGTLTPFCRGTVGAGVSANGTYTQRIIAGSDSVYAINLYAGATFAGSIDNISVRELAGNHEVAINDAARGVYGREPETGTRNRLTYTEQFDNVWSKVQTTVSSNTVAAPDGTTTGDSILDTAVSNIHYCAQDITSLAPSGKTYTVSAYAKANTLNYMTLGLSDISSGTLYAVSVFNLSNGTVSTSSAAGTGYSVVSSSVLSAGNGWYRCIVTVVVGASASFLRSVVAPNKTGVITASAGGFESYLGDGSSFYAWGAQLELGSTATAYQRVVSQYDITESGVASCYYVQPDGVDDAYVTPTITPGTDKAQVFMALKKLNDTGGILMELSASAGPNAGTFYALSGTDTGPLGSVNGYSSLSRGSAAATALQTAQIVQAAPDYAVICATHDIAGDLSTVMRNGVAGTNGTADKGTGNFLAYPVYGYARGGTTLPVAVRDYGHVLRFGPNLDAATIARVNSYLSRNLPTVTL